MRKHPIIICCLIFLLCFPICLVATLPLSLVTNLAGSYLPGNITISNPKGTLWNGSATIYALGEEIIPEWNPRWTDLLKGAIGLDATLNHSLSTLDINTNFNLQKELWINLNGAIDPSIINRFQSDLSISSTTLLDIQDVSARMASGKKLLGANGYLQFSGGPIQYQQSSFSGNLNLPTLEGIIVSNNNIIDIQLQQQSDKLPLANVSIDNGVATIKVYERLAALANPALSTGNGDNVAFSMQRLLF